jgi:predicted Rossmann fold nucleotide-binding protein DprA/Smf involved in DNA uptake
MVDTPRDYAFDLDEVERQVGRICKRIRELPAFDANDALSRLRIEADEALDTAEESQDKAKTELSPTERKIISLCRRKSLPATAIARKTELSDDHVRRVLAKLRKAGRLTNGPGGYRTVRVT